MRVCILAIWHAAGTRNWTTELQISGSPPHFDPLLLQWTKSNHLFNPQMYKLIFLQLVKKVIYLLGNMYFYEKGYVGGPNNTETDYHLWMLWLKMHLTILMNIMYLIWLTFTYSICFYCTPTHDKISTDNFCMVSAIHQLKRPCKAASKDVFQP